MKNAAVPGFASGRVLHGTVQARTLIHLASENLQPDVANM